MLLRRRGRIGYAGALPVLGPELVALDLTSGWFGSAAATIVDADTFSISGAGGVFRDALMTVGLTYRLVLGFSKTGGGGVLGVHNINTATNTALVGSSDQQSGDIVVTFVASNPGLYFRSTTANTITVALSLKRVLG